MREAGMFRSVTGYAIATALICAVGISLLLRPVYRPHEEAAFADRLAQRVEGARTLAPETRDHLMTLLARRPATAAAATDLRRERAIDRLSGAIMQKSAHASR
jgi:hypothetical protein